MAAMRARRVPSGLIKDSTMRKTQESTYGMCWSSMLLRLIITLLMVPTLADNGFMFDDNEMVDESNKTDDVENFTTPAPSALWTNDGTFQTAAPTMAPAIRQSSSSASWLFYTCIFALAVFGSWIIFGYCRKKRELRMLDERSRAADRVLGDMQMIPQDDYDNEII